MGKATFLLPVLRILMILICAGWITLWLLKPTNFWTKAWKDAEAKAKATPFGYCGLSFVVFTLPVILLILIGLIYLNLKTSQQRKRQACSSISLANPLITNSVVGILSGIEILVICLFILFLIWTFYERISNDFKKLLPIKSLKLSMWQIKYLKVATRFGLLAEACLALLLLPVLRGLSVFRVLGIQFEFSVRYHVWLGTAMIFFATFHGISTLFIWGVSHHIEEEIWRWQKKGRIFLAGEISLVIGLVMFITSLQPIRRKMFEIFYYTHHLYVPFLVFFLFHAGDRHFYWVFPGVFLFGIDKLLRLVQSRPETSILSARLFPGKTVELTLPKDPSLKYTPTSVVFMKIPSISSFEWHSFSITSSSRSEEITMSVIIKCDGEWTSSLYQMVQAELDSDLGRRSCIPVAIEGPYGPAFANFQRYDSLLLIAGGIGITPFLSILQEIASASTNYRCKFPTRIQLVHVVKSSNDVCVLNSVSSLLLNQSSKKLNLKLKVFVTREEQFGVAIGELLNDLSKVKTVQFNTNPKHAVHGPESPLWMTAIVGVASIIFLVFVICLNNVFLPSKKKDAPTMKLAVKPERKDGDDKNPSWVSDIIFIGSYLIAMACSILMAIFLRRRRLNNKFPSVSHKKGEAIDMSLVEKTSTAGEHEIHFGGRPNLADIFSSFPDEMGGLDIGVLVCGPESMKESVASLCQLKSQGIRTGAKINRPYFHFHSLNFTL